ncbi:MAG: glycosyltransferase family 4 protein [Rhodospirillaceae bacterium]|jgi:GalNAc-alpha-(1->4)-GalNAc-alpha-(1->3)-diNAcBac-PP-undecaprenol alpha-1,4-N-acetyl-D-galactosaminyltransferase|nr:glycosyltransferase family 4 protein [Rhodospirillaceae bacterium]MBT6427104.1 glycosyltransferase family 4 protein [Rhodospirillaceae bacterium]
MTSYVQPDRETDGHRAAADLCMVIADLSAGGAQRVFSQLANAWAAEGRIITVVTFSDAQVDFFPLVPEIRRISLGGLKPSPGLFNAVAANFRRLHALRRAFKDSGADRILSFTGSMNVLAVLAARGLDLWVSISERNDPTRQSLGRIWNVLRRWSYPMADKVTANSHGAVEALAAFVPREKLAFVPNPIAPAPSSMAAVLPGPSILNVGRLSPQKAQDVLIAAFADLAGEFPDWRLVIVGTGEWEETLRAQAGQLGIADRVLFIGQIDDPFPYYRAARIFALPSRFEGTPNAMLEAMSVSMPCIVSDASRGPLEYVEDGISGLVVAVGDAGKLSAAMRRLMADPEWASTLGDRGRENLSLHSLEAVLGVWAEVLGLPPTQADQLTVDR